MEKQREKARASWAGSGDAATETLWFGLREKLGATEFLGYETENAEGVVTALVRTAKKSMRSSKGETGAVIVNQTPFYGESGGQVGDTGVMTADGVRFRVTDTQKKAGDLFVHPGTVEEGTLKTGDALQLDVDDARRTAIRANHSATHLLHEALRQVLGDHVAQKGSLVAPDRLRFDFSHPKPITAEEIEKVEDIANDFVLQNSPVTTRLMALDDARDPARARCSARNTATKCAWSRWAKAAAATRSAGRSSCAAARMSGAPATSGSSRAHRRRGSPPACAGSKRSPAGRAQAGRRYRARRNAAAHDLLKRNLPNCRRGSRNCSTSASGWNASSPMQRRSSPWAAVRPSPATTACARSAT